MGGQYYLYVDQQYGPYDLSAMQAFIREGRVIPESWVHSDGETRDWTRAADVTSLKTAFPAPKPAPVAPAPGLAEKLKKVSDSKVESLGTMLVGPSAAEGVRSIPTVLPNAPLSDIPPNKTGIATSPESDGGQGGKKGVLSWFKNLFRRKK